MQKQMVEVTVFGGSRYGAGGWPPQDTGGFMAWFNERIESIPPVLRTAAVIRLDSRDDSAGDSSATIEITYVREETDNEANNRVTRAEFAMQQQEIRERQMLVNLQAKYGPVAVAQK